MAKDLTSFLTSRLRQIVSPGSGPTPGNRDGVVIAVAASKGGVGKTTMAVHLAAALSSFGGYRVLLVDLDAQGHVGTSLGLGPCDGKPGLSQVLAENRREVMEVAVPTRVAGLEATPPDKRLAETEKLLNSRIGKEVILQGALKVTRTHYDCIVLDCPPNLGNLTLNGLVAADALLVPCEYSALSFQGVADVLEAVEIVRERLRAEVELLGIVVTQFDRRTVSLNRQVEHLLQSAYGPALLETRVGVSTAMRRAQLEGKTIFQYAPRSRVSEDYRQLAAEVGRRLDGRLPLRVPEG